MLGRHLLPATGGFVAVQATLLLPAFILAEATMSYVGLGFSDRTASWGTMLLDAANVAVLAEVPWALSPAAAIFIVVLAVNLVVQGTPQIVLDRRVRGH
jgi:peptide/nickel transport system permease protein